MAHGLSENIVFLRPCPFCVVGFGAGGDRLGVRAGKVPGSSDLFFRCECNSCHAAAGLRLSVYAAAAEWNSRSLVGILAPAIVPISKVYDAQAVLGQQAESLEIQRVKNLNLKSCPFCGSKDLGVAGKSNDCQVSCRRPTCCLGPKILRNPGDGSPRMIASMDWAVHDWNRRRIASALSRKRVSPDLVPDQQWSVETT